jgi:murein L,D-transpeptidase YcbB/YkuD
VRTGVIACSLLALSFALTGCDPSSNFRQSTASGEDARWNVTTARQLREAIGRRAAHGLDRMQFAAPEGASDEAALTRAALRYAGALARGASDPAKLNAIYSVPRPAPDLTAGLAKALAQGKVDDWLTRLAPQDATYKALSKAYLTLRRQKTDPTSTIPDGGKPIEPGTSDPRIPAIARQLASSDYLDRYAGEGDVYSPALVTAVKRMQADYGIRPDGVIGSDAFEILNLSDADRAREIAVAMERIRWLDRNPPKTRIDVNLASARLAYWRDGKLADTRKVVVGKPETETPQLGSPIYRLVANPTWTVPRSIQNTEIAGKGAAYLRRNNMAWKDGWIVQQPGPKNSLGLVKFDMQNEHQIYLHDTPAKQLFGEVQRQRSHGCVRVEDALGFAAMLAEDEGVTAEWEKARSTGKESFVPLPRPIPVRLIYQTVLLDDAAEPLVRADPYGWNKRVSAALGFPASEGHRLRSAGADVGP